MAPLAERAIEWAAERIGGRVVGAEEWGALQEQLGALDAFSHEAEDLAAMVQDYVDAPPQATIWRRRRLTRRSQEAFIRDPVAGGEAQLLTNFAFGRGIPAPRARDDEVQKIVDRAWKDPINKRKLTGFDAQRKRSNDLLAGANLFPGILTSNGRVRVFFLDETAVTDVVVHPDDDELPLYYVTRKKRVEWDFKLHGPAPALAEYDRDGQVKVYYYPHWQTVEMAKRSAKEYGAEPPPAPPKENLGPGEVEHFRINWIGRTQFGIPPWARTLRYYSARNQLGEAQLQMAQGRASIIAKRTRKGGPRDILKAASNVLSASGELAAARFGRREPSATSPATNPSQGLAPPPAGGFWLENEADKLEAVRLSSGASEALQDAQIFRGAAAAASGFGQHYLGDPSSTNLATASTLELPTLMVVLAWQETHLGMLRSFVNRAIEEAIRAGELGGYIAEEDSDGRPLEDLSYEEDQEELEKRTGKDLAYTIEMPYPGRRNLPDVMTAVQQTVMTFGQLGAELEPLARAMLDYLLRHGFQVDDPTELVDAIIPEGQGQLTPPTAPPPGGPPGGPEQDAQSQYGERRQGSTPPEQMAGGGPGGVPASVMKQALREGLVPQSRSQVVDYREAMAQDPVLDLSGRMKGDVSREFAALLADPSAVLNGHAARKNGDGGHPEDTRPVP